MVEREQKATPSVPGVELTTEHGLAAVRVTTSRASGLVYLQGAHLAAWQPQGHEPVIWMSENAIYAPGKALRGGVPLCFPWFGAHPEHASHPAHGFARTREFRYHGARLDDEGRSELEFSLESDARTRVLFPFDFTARLRIALGETLGLELSITNRDSQPFSFEEALHSYFNVRDVTEVALRGLQGASYADKVRAMAKFRESEAELRFSTETDRVYESSATCTLVDTRAQRTLRIEKSHSATTVVWNPWAEKAALLADLGTDAWRRMLCVESANVGNSRITLAPDESHLLRVRISLASVGDLSSEI